jgi:hypothetical protein
VSLKDRHLALGVSHWGTIDAPLRKWPEGDVRMSKAKKRKSSPASAKPVEMLPGPQTPGRKKYQIWAFVIWVIGIILILLKWGKF